MRIALLILVAASSIVACSQGPGSDPDPSGAASSRLGGDGGVPKSPGAPGIPGLPAIDAGACLPSVQVSAQSCSITVDSTTCDCSDATCIQGAVQSCVSATIPPLPGAGGGVSIDAGIGVGVGGGSCTPTEIQSAKTQFCLDVDKAAQNAGLTVTLDCNAVGTVPTGITPPSSLPTTGVACGDLTQTAAATAAQALAACPAEPLTWDPSARLQLFVDGACMLP